jgi:putative ABC transport system permease protein
MLLKGRVVTAIAVLAMMLAIGANTAIFSVINGVLLKPLPYPEHDRLVRIYEKTPESEITSVSYPNFLDYRQQSQSFEDLSVFRNQGFTITGGQGPERVEGQLVSASLFSVLGVQPAVGRGILQEEDQPGGPLAAVISYGLWQRRFGGDANLPGQPLNVNGKEYTIVGIMPASFKFYSPVDLFIPIGTQNNPTLKVRELRVGIRVIGRLKPGVTLEQARTEVDTLASALASQYPESNEGFGVALFTMQEDLVGKIKPTLLVLFGAVGFVLLIACANVANLLLARAAARQKELAIRRSLGASRWRMIRQLLTESVLLAVTGGLLGLLLAFWATSALTSSIPADVPRTDEIRVDAGVFVFTLVVSLLTGIVFGLVPALQASKPDLNETLKEGGRTARGGHHRVQSLLIIVEAALALVLLIGAGLLIRTIVQLRGVDPGINTNNVLTLKTPLSVVTYNNATKIRNVYEQLLERIGSLPGVLSAAVTADMPFTGASLEIPFWTGGGPRPAPEGMKSALFCPTSAGYAETMGLRLLNGRFIGHQDTHDSPPVAVIDEHLAHGLFGDENPVGKQLSIQGFFKLPDIHCEIVGVVGHVKHFGLDTDASQKLQYQLYFPYLQVPDMLLPRMLENLTIVARTQADPMGIAPEVKNQVLAIDKDQPVNNVRSLDQIVAATTSRQRFSMLLLGIFAGVALILAAVGMYGVMSYAVTQRTHEIGVRMALGAKPGHILRQIIGRGLALTVVGVAIGIGAAFALTRVLENLLFGVSATDPSTFAIIAVLLLAVALAACYIPARRAAKVDPMLALRYE